MHDPTGRIAHTMAFVALADTINSLMGPPCGIDLMTNHIMNRCCTTELHLTPHMGRGLVMVKIMQSSWIAKYTSSWIHITIKSVYKPNLSVG